jgi:hypothetical protein
MSTTSHESVLHILASISVVTVLPFVNLAINEGDSLTNGNLNSPQ